MSVDSAAVSDSFRLVGTTVADKFRIERCVAEGGFGVVYAGTFLSLEKKIALKVLKVPREFNAEAQQEFIDRFALEAKTIARMSHPAIVQVLDFGVSTAPSGVKIPWMALEWLDGETLDDFMMRRRGSGGLAPSEVMKLLRPAFDALAYAHEEGVAHRDIKPGNIMIAEGRRGRSVRLMDFGIAKLMDQGEDAGTGHTRTRTALQAYSPQYASPEQVSGLRTGPWTDVHALALIVCELIMDADPYKGADATQLLGAVISPWRPTPGSVGIDVGPWEPVLKRALALTPADRFPNARAFLDALEASVPTTLGPAAPTNSTGIMQPAAPAMRGTGSTGPTMVAGEPAARDRGAPTPTPSLGTLNAAVVTAQPVAKPGSRNAIVAGVAVVVLATLGGAGFWMMHRQAAPQSRTPAVSTTRMTAAAHRPEVPPNATASGHPASSAPAMASPDGPAVPSTPTPGLPAVQPAVTAVTPPTTEPIVTHESETHTTHSPAVHHAPASTHVPPSTTPQPSHRRRYQVL